MDDLGGLLTGPRARGAFLLRSVLAPPWSMRIEDQAPLTVLSVVRGDAWLQPDSGPPIRLVAGEVTLVRGPDGYLVADGPDRAPDVLIRPDQVCVNLTDNKLIASLDSGVRTWGNTIDDESATVLVTGTYTDAGEIGARLLAALPTILTLPAGDWSSDLIRLLHREIVRRDPGQAVVLDRLLDLLLVAALREWFARPEASPPGWYRALGDDIVGPTLRLMQRQPERPWTVASLAAEVAVSRAALARRFSDLVGMPPMTYLTDWRLALAADLLTDPRNTLESVAAQVGYSNAFALSAAFKRVRGLSPQQYRRTAQAG